MSVPSRVRATAASGSPGFPAAAPSRGSCTSLRASHACLNASCTSYRAGSGQRLLTETTSFPVLGSLPVSLRRSTRTPPGPALPGGAARPGQGTARAAVSAARAAHTAPEPHLRLAFRRNSDSLHAGRRLSLLRLVDRLVHHACRKVARSWARCGGGSVVRALSRRAKVGHPPAPAALRSCHAGIRRARTLVTLAMRQAGRPALQRRMTWTLGSTLLTSSTHACRKPLRGRINMWRRSPLAGRCGGAL